MGKRGSETERQREMYNPNFRRNLIMPLCMCACIGFKIWILSIFPSSSAHQAHIFSCRKEKSMTTSTENDANETWNDLCIILFFVLFFLSFHFLFMWHNSLDLKAKFNGINRLKPVHFSLVPFDFAYYLPSLSFSLYRLDRFDQNMTSEEAEKKHNTREQIRVKQLEITCRLTSHRAH